MSMVEFDNVTKAFGDLVVLHGLDFAVERGEVVFVVGPSGSGKSTLLRCINALEPITGGALLVEGRNVADPRTNIREIRREAGMVFQQFNLFPHMSALGNVSYGVRRVRGKSRREAEAIAMPLLEKVGMADRADHYPDELSGGQAQRVAIARALAVNPDLMLFDEPTSALDPELRYEVLRVMRDVVEAGMTMIVVTHEMSFAREVGTRLLFMDEGRITLDGDPRELMAAPPNQRFADFLVHIQ
ncbi:glutamine ABC transporter ATP-binding protein GlnQ [Arhodomonas aquaeolei]|uniref:glutamine ABC transporter ATP-binding protein GlnQ n=1 Tax=Arhodomonas aquaeolei TaxID=2369 RepID=UPI00286DC60C|nr:glutamine ABC transporter ATP-binding protein GlnQ [Arhodomonas aquaeolei]